MDDYEIGKVYTFKGKNYVYRGGDPDKRSSWIWQPTTEQVGEHVVGLARETAQGATLGWADEIEAALSPRSREQIQEARDKYAEEGGSVLIPQVAGGAAAAIGTGMLAGPRLLASLSPLQKIWALGGIGATEAAVAGAGTAEPGERMAGAGKGARLGTLFGLGFPAVAGLAGTGARTARSIAAPMVEREAAMATAEAMQPALQRGQRFSDLPLAQGDVAADVALEGQMTGARALRDRPENIGDIARQLTARQQELAPRLMQSADVMSGTPAGRSRAQRLDALRASRRAQSKQLYDRAYQSGGVVTDQKALNVLDAIGADDQGARIIAGIRSKYGLQPNQPLSLNHIDEVIRELDSVVSGSYKSGRSPGVLKGYRDNLRDRITEVVPEYAEARRTYAAMKAAENVGEKEARLWKGSYSANDIRYKMGGWSPAQREEFAFGVASDLENEMVKRLSKTNPQSAFNWLRTMRPRLEATFGDAPVSTFFDDVQRLQRQAETFAEAQRGIRGAARAGAERSDLSAQLWTGIAYYANKMFGAAFRTGVQSVVRSPAQQRAFSQQVANLLYQRPAQDALGVLDQVAPFLEMLRRRQGFRQATGAALGGQVAGGLLGNR